MAPSVDEPDKGKSQVRRPANTAFRQQRLKAWQPILTPKTVLPLLFAIGIVFAPLGGLLLYSSTQAQEIVMDYTDCDKLTPDADFATMSTSKFSASFKTALGQKHYPSWKVEKNVTSAIPTAPKYQETRCTLRFNIPNDLGPPVLLYYRLSGFYQNHRKYVQSEDVDQLAGDNKTAGSLSSCSPLITDAATGKPYYPCGLIANSFFNDTFEPPLNTNPAGTSLDNLTYYMTEKNIAWSSDKERFGTTKYTASQVVPPPDWHDSYPEGYNDSNLPDLKGFEAFQVWMRTAGMPTFDKLARRNDTATMPQGTYEVQIYSRFPSRAYGGTKSIVISTRNLIGGRNPSLGIVYIVTGGLAVVLGAVFTARHLIRPRKLGDHTNLSWNDDDAQPPPPPPPHATATGRELPRDH